MRIGLDAAFPPPPAQWVSDIRSVGGSVGFVYVVGGILNYTPDHVTVARQFGCIPVPIVVPGNVPPDYATVLSALRRYGFVAGAVVVDLEPGSEPADSWARGLAVYLAQFGYVVDRYGTSSVLGHYAPENADWIAQWQRRGVLYPIPALPVGWMAWQFVDDIVVNGHTYDASVIDEAFVANTSVGATGTDIGSYLRRMQNMDCKAVRKDGTVDRFVVTPDGATRHVVITPDHVITYDDKMPGSWCAPVDAWWDADESVLTYSGIGWQGGMGGAAWSCAWTNGTWGQPFNEVGQ